MTFKTFGTKLQVLLQITGPADQNVSNILTQDEEHINHTTPHLGIRRLAMSLRWFSSPQMLLRLSITTIGMKFRLVVGCSVGKAVARS